MLPSTRHSENSIEIENLNIAVVKINYLYTLDLDALGQCLLVLWKTFFVNNWRSLVRWVHSEAVDSQLYKMLPCTLHTAFRKLFILCLIVFGILLPG